VTCNFHLPDRASYVGARPLNFVVRLMRGKGRTVVGIAVVVIAGALYFPVRFALTFELLGPAVHSSAKGWLGPTPRDAGACVVDAGKVNIWVCPDASVFAQHRYGCQTWLHLFRYGDV
jgi:hypothetical protein